MLFSNDFFEQCPHSTHPLERRPGADELQDQGVGILLDGVRDVGLRHLVERVPPRPDVVHEDLVGRQLELDGRARVVHLLELHAVPQLPDHLPPEPRLQQKQQLKQETTGTRPAAARAAAKLNIT